MSEYISTTRKLVRVSMNKKELQFFISACDRIEDQMHFLLEQRSVVVRVGLTFMLTADTKQLKSALEKMPERSVRTAKGKKAKTFTVTIPSEEILILEKCSEVLAKKIGFYPLSCSQICRIGIGLIREMDPTIVARKVEEMPVGKIGPKHRKALG